MGEGNIGKGTGCSKDTGKAREHTYHVVGGQEGIVHSHDLQVGVTLQGSAEDQAPNATKTVDSNLNLTHNVAE